MNIINNIPFEVFQQLTPLLSLLKQATIIFGKVIIPKISIHPFQVILVLVSKFQVNVTQKLVNIRQLKYFLESHNKDQLEFIVKLVLQCQIVVIKWILTSSFLKIDENLKFARTFTFFFVQLKNSPEELHCELAHLRMVQKNHLYS